MNGELTLSMSAQEVTAAVVVSEEVDDLILEIDWLDRHRCRWSFAQNLIEIDGKVVRLSADLPEHAEEHLCRRKRCGPGRAYNKRAGDHGLVVAPSDDRRLGRGVTIFENRHIGRKDSDERCREAFGRSGDEREQGGREEFIGEAEQVIASGRQQGNGLETVRGRGCLPERSGGSFGKTGRGTGLSREQEC